MDLHSAKRSMICANQLKGLQCGKGQNASIKAEQPMAVSVSLHP